MLSSGPHSRRCLSTRRLGVVMSAGVSGGRDTLVMNKDRVGRRGGSKRLDS